VGYSIGIGALAGRWVHNNPLLGVVIAVGFAVVLGVIVDHSLRWWHKHLEKRDAEKKAASAEAAAADAGTAINAAAGVDRSHPAG
jgi:NhaP-type Na+/H+ or K+/H+ antiporter